MIDGCKFECEEDDAYSDQYIYVDVCIRPVLPSSPVLYCKAHPIFSAAGFYKFFSLRKNICKDIRPIYIRLIYTGFSRISSYAKKGNFLNMFDSRYP